VTDPIVKIDGNTIITASGSRTDVDVIVLGTGFYVSEPPIAERVTGVGGITMAQHWQGSPQAYKGTTLHGFPNLFVLLGPNLAIGHNSAFIVIEAQLNQVMQALQLMQQQQLTRLEPRRAIQADYNHQVQHALQRTVWNTGGCSSYYIDKNGRNSIGFPWSTLKMRQVLGEFSPHDFNLQTTAPVGVNHA
jgi:cyclohexanone monooxygenase